MLTTYPAFQKLNINQKNLIEDYTLQYEPYSDFNFTSLFCWDIDNSVSVCTLNNNLIIQLPDYITSKPVYSLIGSNKIDETISELVDKFGLLQLVPEYTISKLKNKDNFNLTLDRDNYDYVYDIDKLVEMAGKEFAKERNYLSKFERMHSTDMKIINLENSIEQYSKDINQVLSNWMKSPNKDLAEAKNEYIAINRLINNSNNLNVSGILVYLKNKPVAFAIYEILNDGWAISHFEKADISVVRVFLLVKHQSFLAMKSKNCRLANYEQDLGIDGLRQAKLSHHPVRFLKKYTISLKPNNR